MMAFDNILGKVKKEREVDDKSKDVLTILWEKPIENMVRKGENAGNQHFLLFLLCFLSCQRRKLLLKQYLICHV